MIDDINVTANLANGIKENSLPQNGVIVFPNPSKGEFTISGQGEETLVITNELGEFIQKVQLNSGNNFKPE
jgi:hypothetical protein